MTGLVSKCKVYVACVSVPEGDQVGDKVKDARTKELCLYALVSGEPLKIFKEKCTIIKLCFSKTNLY